MAPSTRAERAAASDVRPAKRARTATVADEERRALTCPITGELFVDPVTTCLGNCYERWAITRWLVRSDRDPLTNATLPVKTLYPATLVRQLAAAARAGDVPAASWADMAGEAVALPHPGPAAALLSVMVRAGLPASTRVTAGKYTGSVAHWAVRLKHTDLLTLVQPAFADCAPDSNGETVAQLVLADVAALDERAAAARAAAEKAALHASEFEAQLGVWKATIAC